LLLLVAVIKFAWNRSTARRRPVPINSDDIDDLDWDARQSHDHGQASSWDSSHHHDSSHSDTSHSDSSFSDTSYGDSSSSDGGGGGGDSSSD